MSSVLFVHGTGVRGLSYIQTYQIVQEALANYCPQHELEPCKWGDDLGSQLPQLSLPDRRSEIKRKEVLSATAEQEFARWQLLYQDPLFELRLLKNRPLTPSDSPDRPDIELWERIEHYAPSTKVKDCLERYHLKDYWSVAWDAVVVADQTAYEVLHSSPNEIAEPAQAVARALVAVMTISGLNDHVPLVSGARRDELVALLVQDWQADVAAIGAYLLEMASDIARTVATPLIRRKREDLSTAAAPASGDILLYQVRGETIRSYIRDRVEQVSKETGGDVILLAHSLGGIACVDLLARTHLPQVKKLITAGSQAPLLYEINALWSLERKNGEQLRKDFPEWLNLYDPYDFLSYLAAPVFKLKTIQDRRIESGQPFPESHSAYWQNSDTWKAIAEFVP